MRKPKKPKNPESEPRQWYFTTLEDWRNDDDCVAYLATLFSQPMFRAFLGMLHQHAHQSVVGYEAPTPERKLGYIEGQQKLLEVIQMAGVPVQQNIQLYNNLESEEPEEEIL